MYYIKNKIKRMKYNARINKYKTQIIESDYKTKEILNNVEIAIQKLIQQSEISLDEGKDLLDKAMSDFSKDCKICKKKLNKTILGDDLK